MTRNTLVWLIVIVAVAVVLGGASLIVANNLARLALAHLSDSFIDASLSGHLVSAGNDNTVAIKRLPRSSGAECARPA